MTANELANELQELDSKLHLINLFKAATMLRQQETEIENLRKELALQKLSDISQEIENEPVAWISVLAIDHIGQKFTDVRVSLTKTDVADIPLYTHPMREEIDANRYKWLRNEFANGRETYLAEGIPSGEQLDKYIDEQLKKASDKC